MPIGQYSFIGDYTHIAQNVEIGRYCSIANLCTIGAQQHPLDRLSTYPSRPRGDERKTVIGHDVWIGCNSVIMSGVTIGIGAVIGAGSVVTKDISPYAIAYGSPARIKRYRFEPDEIAILLKSKWWELPIELAKQLPIKNPKAYIKRMGKP